MSAVGWTEAYLQEGRDAHGRWVSGFGDLKSAVEGMVSSGDIDASTGKAVVSAMVRHTGMGRGIPGMPHEHAKALEYLAKTLRHDSLSLRQQKDPNIAESKRLSRLARQVETAHAKHVGIERKNMKGTDANLLTPEATSLGTGKPGNVLDLNPKLKAKAEAPKVTPAASPKVVDTSPKLVHSAVSKVVAQTPLTGPQEPAHEATDPKAVTTKAVEDIKKGETVQTPEGAKTVKSIRLWADGRVSLRWTSGDKKSTTYTPGRNLVVGSQSVTPKEMAMATVKSKAPKVKVVPDAKPKVKQAVGPKVVFHVKSPKVTQKVQTVKVSAANLKVGDIIDMGQARIGVGTKEKKSKYYSHYTQAVTAYQRIKLERRVEAVTPSEDGKGVRLQLSAPLDARLTDPSVQPGIKDKGGYYSYYVKLDTEPGEVTKPNTETVKVKRSVSVSKAVGSKVKLDEHPDVQAYHAALAQALANGDDLTPYDPANRPLATGQHVGHAQQLLYDMAVGQRSGRVSNQNVVTHQEYVTRLIDSGEASRINRDVHAAIPYRFTNINPSSYGFVKGLPELPANSSDEQLARMSLATASDFDDRRKWVEQYKALMGHEPTMHEYAASFTPEQIAPILGGNTVTALKTSHQNEVQKQAKVAIDARIAELRKAESTTDRNFNIPTWGNSPLEPQTWDSIQSHINAQSAPQVTHPAVGLLAARTGMASKDYTPSFYAAGIVDDGVLYHRITPGVLDARKVESTLAGILQAPTMHDGVPAPGFGPAEALNNARVFATIAGYDDNAGKVDTLENMKTKIIAAKNINDETRVRLLSAIDRVDAKVMGEPVTTGHVSQPGNNAMRKIMNSLGAAEVSNDKASTGKGNWTTLQNGTMLLHQDGGEAPPADVQLAASRVMQAMPQWQNHQDYSNDVSGNLRAQYENATTLEERAAAIDGYEKAIKAMPTDTAQSGWVSPAQLKKLNEWTGYARQAVNAARAMRMPSADNPIRTIEYVPWQQPAGPTVIARSGRGRLTLTGYTPAEAHAKLRELGVIGNLEPHIPGDAIFGSGRRSGSVTPMLPAYVRGEATPPTTENLLTHGVTSRGDPFKEFERIARSGGLMSLAERTKRGIRTSTTSQVGDIASGVDHVNFTSLGGGGGVGSGAAVRIVLRPDVLLRRDAVLAPTDFGGGKDRFGRYREYRDKLDAQAGVEVGKTDLWSPLSPGARQIHLDNLNDRPGSSEYNVAGLISIEDMQSIAARDPAVAEQIKSLLADLKAQGVIARVPEVVPYGQFSKAAKGEPIGANTIVPKVGDSIDFVPNNVANTYTSKVKEVKDLAKPSPYVVTETNHIVPIGDILKVKGKGFNP